jgi:acetyltransferase-like isoleucine patch superfamily enzyme
MATEDAAPARLPAAEPFFMPDWGRIERLMAAGRLAKRYSQMIETDYPAARALLIELLGTVHETAHVGPITVEYGKNITIGANSLVNNNCLLMDCFPIEIGDRVLIAPFCQLITGGHEIRTADRFVTNDKGELGTMTTGAPIRIEDEAWLGAGVIVLPGIVIGARTTVGAGSVVTKPLPPDVLAAGNPCRVIRRIEP